jgi:hypothetical protein
MQQSVIYRNCVLWIVRASKSCMHMQQSVIYRICVLWIVRGSKAVCICSKVLKLNPKIRIVGNTSVEAVRTCSKVLNTKIRIVGNTSV